MGSGGCTAVALHKLGVFPSVARAKRVLNEKIPYITAKLRADGAHAMELAYEKTMLPSVFVAKKAYAYVCHAPGKPPTHVSMGLMSKKRGTAALFKDAYIDCERAFLAALDGNCRTPIADQAKLVDGELYFEGLIAKPDGTVLYRTTRTGSPADAVKIGTEAGEELKEQVGGDSQDFFGDHEILPEPKSSVSGIETDGLGGYKAGEYAMDDSGSNPNFVPTE